MAEGVEGSLDRGAPVGGRLNVAEFLALLRAGAVPGGPRAELVAGRVEVPPLPSPREVAAVVALASRLEPQLALRAALAFRPALHLADADLLRPDLALLDASPRFGRAAARPGSEALLVVEAVRGARSLDVRLPRYAAGGVSEAWLLDLSRDWVEVYRSPGHGRYGSRTLWYRGEPIGVTALPGVAAEALGTL